MYEDKIITYIINKLEAAKSETDILILKTELKTMLKCIGHIYDAKERSSVVYWLFEEEKNDAE